jgi:excisionase family DNA binding protein
MNANTPAALLVDRREAARLLGVSPGSVDNLRLRGELPSLRLGARRLFDRRDLIALVDARKTIAPTVLPGTTLGPGASAYIGGSAGDGGT